MIHRALLKRNQTRQDSHVSRSYLPMEQMRERSSDREKPKKTSENGDVWSSVGGNPIVLY